MKQFREENARKMVMWKEKHKLWDSASQNASSDVPILMGTYITKHIDARNLYILAYKRCKIVGMFSYADIKRPERR